MATNIGGSAEKDERMWGMLCHLAAFIGLIGPLVVWLIKRDQYAFVNDQGKESLNFQITVFICLAVLQVASRILFLLFVTAPLALVTGLAMFAVGVFNIIQIIMASIKANEGVAYRYPFALKLVQ